jgi:hypothetical protein
MPSVSRQDMDTVASRRRTEIARIQRLLERLHSPRLQMMLIVALTAAVGFLVSFALLHAGVESLWLRYGLAVAIAYLAFLFFLWCWLRLRSSDLLDGLDLPSPSSGSPHSLHKTWEPGGGQFGGGGSSGSFDDGTAVARFSGNSGSASSSSGSGISDAVGGFDLEEFAVVLLALAALIGAAFAAFWIVWAAPALFAELMLDAALAAGLYRRLRSVEGDHWLNTAVRRTLWPFVGVAVLFSLGGACVQIYVPAAKSIGQVMQHYKEPR